MALLVAEGCIIILLLIGGLTVLFLTVRHAKVTAMLEEMQIFYGQVVVVVVLVRQEVVELVITLKGDPVDYGLIIDNGGSLFILQAVDQVVGVISLVIKIVDKAGVLEVEAMVVETTKQEVTV